MKNYIGTHTGFNIKKLIVVLAVLLMGCGPSIVYEQQEAVEATGWEAENKKDFRFEISDTSKLYNIAIIVKHSELYPYANLWCFTEITAPNSAVLIDTVNLQLADHTGEWYGKKFMSTFSVMHPFKQGIKFVKPGNYYFSVQQGMRYQKLKQIEAIGVRVSEFQQ